MFPLKGLLSGMFGLVTFLIAEDIFSNTRKFLQNRKASPKIRISFPTPFTAARQPHYPGDSPGNGKNDRLQKIENPKNEPQKPNTVKSFPHFNSSVSTSSLWKFSKQWKNRNSTNERKTPNNEKTPL
jgi:hypothetical protein